MKKYVFLITLILVVYSSVSAPSEEIGPDVFQFEHAPYAERECEECHSSNKPNGDDLSGASHELCFGCHDSFEGEFLHSPVGAGDCLLCHDPHGSDSAVFLKIKEPDLCYLCHEELESKINENRSMVHGPALESCTVCHNPHVSNVNSYLLTSEVKKLCVECHANNEIAMSVDSETVLYKHKPVESIKSCSHCHDAHASPYKHHLLAKAMDLCLKCHNKQMIDDEGKHLTNIKQLLEENTIHHGPIKQKNCSGCHSPHGSNYYRLLLAEYPKEFYTSSFNKADYNLCFLCHDSRMLDKKETRSLTRFRDGNKNLHYLHVNKVEKGRTCRACHEVHASNNLNHIRESVPFGKINWPLQLKYEPLYMDKKTGTRCNKPDADCVQKGGSCIACHNRKYYNNSELGK